jgi:hypothetical protein
VPSGQWSVVRESVESVGQWSGPYAHQPPQPAANSTQIGGQWVGGLVGWWWVGGGLVVGRWWVVGGSSVGC